MCYCQPVAEMAAAHVRWHWIALHCWIAATAAVATALPKVAAAVVAAGTAAASTTPLSKDNKTTPLAASCPVLICMDHVNVLRLKQWVLVHVDKPTCIVKRNAIYK